MDKEKLIENFRQVLDGLPEDADITKFLFGIIEEDSGFYTVAANGKAYSGSRGEKLEVLADSLSIIVGLVTVHLMATDGVDLRAALDKLFTILKQENEERLVIIEQFKQKNH